MKSNGTMDEDSYRQLYERINTAPCAFEKGILSLKCQCAYQHMFRLADRHGVGCTDALMQQNCSDFLNHLRKQTRFVFKIDIEGPLPHNKEIKVQNGGMLGMQALLLNDTETQTVQDISNLMQKSMEIYGGLQSIPYNLLMPAVTRFKTRPKRQRSK
jgi:hypothetical protein